MRVDKITGRDLDGFYVAWQQRGLSSSSVHQHHSILHAALGRTVKWGLIQSNPADRATPPYPKRATVGVPAITDIQRLIANAGTHDPVLGAAIALGAVTGARRGELCALRWPDVDWSRRTMSVARSLTVIDKIATEGPTKAHQRRTIALAPERAVGSKPVGLAVDQATGTVYVTNTVSGTMSVLNAR